jgi:hypothetical protein
MTTPEAKVRDPVVRWAKSRNIMHVRMSFRPGVSAGVPDDLFLLPGGVSIWIEFKRPGKEPTPLQMEKIQQLKYRGHVAMWTDNATDGITALGMALEATQGLPSSIQQFAADKAREAIRK